MKKYFDPEIEVIKLDVEDVVNFSSVNEGSDETENEIDW